MLTVWRSSEGERAPGSSAAGTQAVEGSGLKERRRRPVCSRRQGGPLPCFHRCRLDGRIQQMQADRLWQEETGAISYHVSVAEAACREGSLGGKPESATV